MLKWAANDFFSFLCGFDFSEEELIIPRPLSSLFPEVKRGLLLHGKIIVVV
jgi:hypothetical protein